MRMKTMEVVPVVMDANEGLQGSSTVTQRILDELNVAQGRQENRKRLEDLGGVTSLAASLGTDLTTGLTKVQVQQLREKFGSNEFPETPLDSFFKLLFEALTDSTLLILIAAATVSTVIGTLTHDNGWIEGTAIFIAIFLVSNIAAGNDYSKQLQFRALEKSSANDERASVLREGFVERINPKEIVVGDVLVLQAGDSIPADCILLDRNIILSNESSLTGEPDDLKKSRDGDCFLLSSCLLTEGEDSRALVIGIGINSQWGKIKQNLVTEAVNTPLQDKLADMATTVGKVGMLFAIGTFIAEIASIWARHDGTNVATRIVNAFIIAVTVVVVSIPEGLPLAVTISLAYSTKKMYQDQCFIRVLAACETMGNATNICSDKTGTLTENRMTVVEGWFANKVVDQEEFQQSHCLPTIVEKMLAEHCSVNRSAYLIYKDPEGKMLHQPMIIGNKTEGALIMMIKSWGYDYEEVRNTIFHEEQEDKVFSFNSAKKRSTAVVHIPDGSVKIFVKGASEWILQDCSHVSSVTPDGRIVAIPLTSEMRRQLEQKILDMADQALRTLCLAHRDFDSANHLPKDWKEYPPDSSELILDCIVGIIDPLRSDVKEAVRIAQQAGVTVRMVTGDNIATASAIARQCGILTTTGTALEGPVFRKMKPKDVDRILPNLQVLARSSPDDKYLLVTRLNGHGIPSTKEEWQQKFKGKDVTWETDRDLILPGYREEWEEHRPEGGQVVGVTGDGTNDAPALKAADVGLAMGITGTKVAQSAADIVILDDKFSSIVKAISWGRCVFDNIRKFLQFQLTVNLVALWLVFIAALSGYAVPLNAVQLLWVNLVMDTLGALALGTELPTAQLLERKPYKRSAFLLSRPMIRNIVCQAIFQLILLLILLFQGPALFGVNSANTCDKYEVKDSESVWNLFTRKKDDEEGTFSCDDFKRYCSPAGDNCLEDMKTFTVNGEEVSLKIKDLVDFTGTCLGTCMKFDYTLNTIIFNTFIFCQFFNEYNGRNLLDEWNAFRDIHQNPVFLIVSVVTFGMQIMLVEVGGEFLKTTPLTMTQWLVTVALGAISIPVGILMRLIPVKEDPRSFFDNSIDPADTNALEDNCFDPSIKSKVSAVVVPAP